MRLRIEVPRWHEPIEIESSDIRFQEFPEANQTKVWVDGEMPVVFDTHETIFTLLPQRSES